MIRRVASPAGFNLPHSFFARSSSTSFEPRGAEAVRRQIRVSPQKLNLLTRQIGGLRVEDALTQMKFSKKRHSKVISQVLQNAANLADINHGITTRDLVSTFVASRRPIS
jgi:ribosomal protein L22